MKPSIPLNKIIPLKEYIEKEVNILLDDISKPATLAEIAPGLRDSVKAYCIELAKSQLEAGTDRAGNYIDWKEIDMAAGHYIAGYSGALGKQW